jgi:hypothetical protein
MNILPIVAISLVFVVSCTGDIAAVTFAGGSAASGTLVLSGGVGPTDETGPAGPGTPPGTTPSGPDGDSGDGDNDEADDDNDDDSSGGKSCRRTGGNTGATGVATPPEWSQVHRSSASKRCTAPNGKAVGWNRNHSDD